MVPILLCMGGWVWSGTHKGEIDYARNGCFIQGGTESGVVWVGSGGERGGTGIPDGWIFAAVPNASRLPIGPPAHFWPLGPAQIPSFLGFGWVRAAPASFSVGGVAYVGVPYWLLILVFTGLLFIVWRKTSRKMIRRAFPVQLAEQS